MRINHLLGAFIGSDFKPRSSESPEFGKLHFLLSFHHFPLAGYIVPSVLVLLLLKGRSSILYGFTSFLPGWSVQSFTLDVKSTVSCLSTATLPFSISTSSQCGFSSESKRFWQVFLWSHGFSFHFNASAAPAKRTPKRPALQLRNSTFPWPPRTTLFHAASPPNLCPPFSLSLFSQGI